MADGALSPPALVRRTFLIEAQGRGDIVLRVLGLFAVQGAEIVMIEAGQEAERASIRIETGDLGEGAAERLAGRLRAMPTVSGVGLGWRTT